MFSKETYTKRRKQGLRGQEPSPNPIIGQAKIEHHTNEPGTRKQRRAADLGTIHGTGRMRRRGSL